MDEALHDSKSDLLYTAQIRRYAPEAGGDMLTCTEELRQEGLQKGHLCNFTIMVDRYRHG
ncbi:hypothetical protein CLDAP_40420 [Caldilinea aerophila DSM 14535 = NBRC 104270]|uniref:Uncharacterized protein n=1 Tax=Caldilinea aerophila (strain DSM 14535 / JCM 11387 / NBRC 104270 / STL-6-O1) TaxID=926550 RepID=I0I9Z4_CALAS|nr:hypothetical protein CLDAP_40420 [Caldilinea aerophila DSM 14535 = NBRC 104270]